MTDRYPPRAKHHDWPNCECLYFAWGPEMGAYDAEGHHPSCDQRGTAMQEAEKIEVDKAEYDWLVWFAQMADFGPADGDVRYHLQQMYERDTGNAVPEDWRYE